MAMGRVKWFDEKKGFGFIVPDDGSEELFVHYTGIIGTGFKTLCEAQSVEYVVIQSPKGPKADRVKPVAMAAS